MLAARYTPSRASGESFRTSSRSTSGRVMIIAVACLRTSGVKSSAASIQRASAVASVGWITPSAQAAAAQR